MITYILCGVIVLLLITHHFERKDLYNRIMSRDLIEYKGEKSFYTPSAHKKRLERWRRKDDL